MTSAPHHPCRFPRCAVLVPAGEGTHCATHRPAARLTEAVRDRQRGSAAARGYDAAWQQARLRFLARWPLCPGTLIPDLAVWTPALAQAFHALRERQVEAGHFAAYAPAVAAWLLHHPIYRIEPWDVGRPALVVDHIVPHKGDTDLLWSEWNWQPLTKRAHDRKTGTEQKGQPRSTLEAPL